MITKLQQLREGNDPSARMFRLLNEKTMAEAVGKMDMMKGETGEKGDKGDIGLTGLRGTDGRNGLNGIDGKNGRDGVDGLPGKNGKDGKNGENGINADTQEVIDAVLKTIQDNKLKIEHIDGLPKTLKELITHLKMGGFRGGGGSTGTTGTNVYNEVVAGATNTFTLAHVPTTGTVRLYARGQRILPTSGFTIAGAVITTVDTFLAGDIYADYRY